MRSKRRSPRPAAIRPTGASPADVRHAALLDAGPSPPDLSDRHGQQLSALPPELMRKGRFDEIFFVDLPGQEERDAIFSIQLRKRPRDKANFDMAHWWPPPKATAARRSSRRSSPACTPPSPRKPGARPAHPGGDPRQPAAVGRNTRARRPPPRLGQRPLRPGGLNERSHSRPGDAACRRDATCRRGILPRQSGTGVVSVRAQNGRMPLLKVSPAARIWPEPPLTMQDCTKHLSHQRKKAIMGIVRWPV